MGTERKEAEEAEEAWRGINEAGSQSKCGLSFWGFDHGLNGNLSPQSYNHIVAQRSSQFLRIY